MYHYSQECLVVYSLAGSSHQCGETAKFIYLIRGPGAYELPKVVECSTEFSFLHVLMLKCKPCCQIQIVNIEVAELAVWPCDDTKACCVLQANSRHLKSERA